LQLLSSGKVLSPYKSNSCNEVLFAPYAITYKPGEIKIALYDHPVERGLFKIGDAVNPEGNYAFSGINWLPE